MILLIIIHLLGPPPQMQKTLDGWPPSEGISRTGWPSSGELLPRYFTSPAFRVSEKPMPSMERCEQFARILKDKGTLLYCVDVGRKGTFQ